MFGARHLETLELRNMEYLFTMSKIPPITAEHKERMLNNINKFKPVDWVEKKRKEIVIKQLNSLTTTD